MSNGRWLAFAASYPRLAIRIGTISGSYTELSFSKPSIILHFGGDKEGRPGKGAAAALTGIVVWLCLRFQKVKSVQNAKTAAPQEGPPLFSSLGASMR